MAEIRWSEEAYHRLRDIFDYIAQDNPAAARRVVQAIFEKVQVLRRFPEMGHKYRSASKGEIRILLYGHYRIAYCFSRTGTIDILGVFHGALDIEHYLF